MFVKFIIFKSKNVVYKFFIYIIFVHVFYLLKTQF